MTTINIHSSARKVAEDYANTIWNQKEISTIDRLVHKDVLIHSLLGDFRGTQAIKEIVTMHIDQKVMVHMSLSSKLEISTI